MWLRRRIHTMFKHVKIESQREIILAAIAALAHLVSHFFQVLKMFLKTVQNLLSILIKCVNIY